MSRLNANGTLSTVSRVETDERGSLIEYLSCGHDQYMAPHAKAALRSGKIKSTVGANRKCWTCKSGGAR